jgi:hypothetical protein
MIPVANESAGAQRLHGRRFPPEGLGLDAKRLQAPKDREQRSQPAAVIVSSREGSSPHGEDGPPPTKLRDGFVRRLPSQPAE